MIGDNTDKNYKDFLLRQKLWNDDCFTAHNLKGLWVKVVVNELQNESEKDK